MESDREIVAAWYAEQSLMCNRCHTRKDEWENDPFAYVAATHRCEGCEVLDVEEESFREAPGSLKGLKLYLRKRELADLPKI